MRVIFMGTPEFAVPSLKALDDAFEVACVLTRPDAVRSRGKKLDPSPVKLEATARNLRVIETNRITPEVLSDLAALKADIICVAAYGCILPDAVLELCPLGCINVHASLLPRWRGAAPIQRAVLTGDERAGVSIMRVVHELDAGAYCSQVSTEVADKPCAQVMAELAELGASALVEAVHDIEVGHAMWVEQDEALVTYAHKIDKAEMRLDPAATAEENARRVQASMDAAPARCTIAGKGVRVMRAREATADDVMQLAEALAPVAVGEASTGILAAPGSVLVAHKRVLLACAEGSLLDLVSVKPDGKREMDVAAWAAGLRGDGLTWERA